MSTSLSLAETKRSPARVVLDTSRAQKVAFVAVVAVPLCVLWCFPRFYELAFSEGLPLLITSGAILSLHTLAALYLGRRIEFCDRGLRIREITWREIPYDKCTFTRCAPSDRTRAETVRVRLPLRGWIREGFILSADWQWGDLSRDAIQFLEERGLLPAEATGALSVPAAQGGELSPGPESPSRSR